MNQSGGSAATMAIQWCESRFRNRADECEWAQPTREGNS